MSILGGGGHDKHEMSTGYCFNAVPAPQTRDVDPVRFNAMQTIILVALFSLYYCKQYIADGSE